MPVISLVVKQIISTVEIHKEWSSEGSCYCQKILSEDRNYKRFLSLWWSARTHFVLHEKKVWKPRDLMEIMTLKSQW